MAKQNKEGSLGAKVAATIAKGMEVILKPFWDLLWKPLELFLDYLCGLYSRGEHTGSIPGEKVLVKLGIPRDIFLTFEDEISKQHWIVQPFSRIIRAATVLSLCLEQATQGYLIKVRQKLLSELTPSLPTTEEAITAAHRGVISWGEALNIGGTEGFPEWVTEVKDAVRRPLLDVTSLQDLYLRGEIGEGTFKQYLSWHGYRSQDAENLRKLSYYIPPPPDLIRMAIRECFTPAIAERYGQFQDFPAEFVKYAGMRGISPEWAKMYWAAHWELPSLTMGYEMLHRNVISLDDLKMLMRAQDVMPYWRDKLIAISYSPYTRVDVRRMHAIGVLSPDEVKRAYMDLGFDSAKAEKMTQFTLTYNTARERDLTKADILDALDRNIITEGKAREMIKKLKYSDYEADIFIQRTMLKRAEKYKKQVVSNVKTRFERGIITENEVISRLSAINIPSSEIQEYIRLWSSTRGAQVFSPPLGDLKSLLKDRIITEGEFTDEMIKRGCSQKYISWYIKQAAMGRRA